MFSNTERKKNLKNNDFKQKTLRQISSMFFFLFEIVVHNIVISGEIKMN